MSALLPISEVLAQHSIHCEHIPQISLRLSEIDLKLTQHDHQDFGRSDSNYWKMINHHTVVMFPLDT